MPVFEAKTLDAEFEGQGLLMAILHPTRAAQTRARTHGRQRIERAAVMAAPLTIESRFPNRSDDLAITSAPTN